LSDAILQRLAFHVVTGDEDGAEAYLLSLPRCDREPVSVRSMIEQRCLPEFVALARSVLPWLWSADADGVIDAKRRVRCELRLARAEGRTASDLAARFRRIPPQLLRQALAEMVQARDLVLERRATRGRAAGLYRLAEFAGGIVPANIMEDPFAFRPKPLRGG
jgi:hypothetical protein